METIPTQRRVQRIRREVVRRELTVRRVARISANFVSVTFAGDALAGFASDAFDDHVKFMFVDPTGELVRRDYTPTRFDPAARELTLEFALHAQGPASDWARRAAAGQPVVIGGPRGSMIVPLDYEWHLLAGDATALPAIQRRLEELPAGVRAVVVVQLDDPADRRTFETAATLDLHWVATADELVARVSALRLPSADGFVWCAGEAQQMARLRQVLLVEKGHPREAARIAAYWKHGAAEFHETLDR